MAPPCGEPHTPFRNKDILMNLKRTLLSTAVLATSLASAPALADLTPITGFYFGALGGQADFGQSRGAFDQITLDTLAEVGFTDINGFSELDNEDIGFGVFAGYRIWDYFAIEGQYLDIGEMKYTADVTGTLGGTPDVPANLELTQAVSGPAIALVGILPFDGPWEIYARAGMLFADTEFCARGEIDGEADSFCDSESSEEPMAALGFTFHIGDHISVRAEYTKVFDVGSEEDEMEEDVNFINLHFAWRL
jgi:opacity protein-like surface antigen